jgi:protein-L-isoaspartate(D-aspartate) O-methyltransferase
MFPNAQESAGLVSFHETIGRRGLIGGAAALVAMPALAANASQAPGPAVQAAPALAPESPQPAPAQLSTPATPNGKPWDKAAFEAAMAASDRRVDLTDAQFEDIQARKPAAMKAIANYLKTRLGEADPLVLAAFQALPREYYHYNYELHHTTCGDAYDSPPKPWALGYGSALSDYLGQAYMTQVCAPKPGQVSLEIGTGSGFQSSLLSRIVDHAYSIEIIQPLGTAVKKIFAPLGYDNITTKVGDGYYGWPEQKDGFDIIIVTCAAQYAPPALFQQLKPGGRMIIPIGQPFKQGQVFYVYRKDAAGKIHSRRDMGCFFIPMTGTMMTTPAAQARATPA